MSFKFGYSDMSGDDFEVFLSQIEADCEKTAKEMEEEAAELVKAKVVAGLNRHRRTIEDRYKGRPAMAENVVIRRRTDKFGDKYVKIMGDKDTGTLWHLVNDGNLHSSPTHFMDMALAELDGNIDRLWEKMERYLNDK